MKSITLFLCLILSFCVNSFGQVYNKLADSDVDSKKIEFARKFATDYMTAQKSNSYYLFKDEAIDVLKTQLTEERQRAGYKQLKDIFGDFKSLDYAETWIQKDNSAFKILRFKSDFEKSDSDADGRVDHRRAVGVVSAAAEGDG